jgi:alpha-tubulin suppressor-like RCC1 family protein
VGSGGAATGGAVAVDGGVLAGIEGPVSAGYGHTCGVNGTGRLSCWGQNNAMALGGAGGAQSTTPVSVVAPAAAGGFEDVGAGNAFACARHGDGRVFCWGDNTRGTLATGDTSVKLVPVAVSLPTSAVQLAIKERVACALLADGTVWCWGDNTEGQAGQDEQPPYTDALTPLRVPGTGYTFVSAGQGHVCALRSPGSLWCWGRNTTGQLGQGFTTPDQLRTPVRVGPADDWKMVSAGAFGTCAVRKDDSLWCWGDNSASQLGLGDASPRTEPARVGVANDWMTVSTHAFHTCGLRRPGTMWCWGRRDEGAGGLPWASTSVAVPTQSGTATDWVEVSSGWMHSCAVRASGTHWCTGDNPDGRVGDGTTTRPYTFVQTRPLP